MTATLFDLDADAIAVTTDDWYTPRWVFDAAGLTFDMDVAAPINPDYRTVPARRYLTLLDDGLTTEWGGRSGATRRTPRPNPGRIAGQHIPTA